MTSPFDYIKLLTSNKTSWKNLTETQRKDFQPYMIHRILSMHVDLIDVANYVQQLWNVLTPKLVYDLYFDLLPKSNIFIKYITKKSESKYNSTLLDYISKHFEISKTVAMDYIDIFKMTDSGIDDLRILLGKYGLDDSEIKKIIK